MNRSSSWPEALAPGRMSHLPAATNLETFFQVGRHLMCLESREKPIISLCPSGSASEATPREANSLTISSRISLAMSRSSASTAKLSMYNIRAPWFAVFFPKAGQGCLSMTQGKELRCPIMCTCAVCMKKTDHDQPMGSTLTEKL